MTEFNPSNPQPDAYKVGFIRGMAAGFLVGLTFCTLALFFIWPNYDLGGFKVGQPVEDLGGQRWVVVSVEKSAGLIICTLMSPKPLAELRRGTFYPQELRGLPSFQAVRQ